MNILYEEDGELKVGAVLASAPASLQVESPHGRRTKVKAANVVLNFEQPPAAELYARASAFAQELDADFLWQCSGGDEFGFAELARDYVGRDPTAIESAGVLMKLQTAPMYFRRRGRGRFQAAPEKDLRAALAGQEKKKRQQEAIAAWAESLCSGECPAPVAALRDELLYAPDRNKPETKAFEQACRDTGLSPARLLERCGLLPDSEAYHLNRFLFELYPRGTGFPPHAGPAGIDPALPLAAVPVFSLDDSGTTEIDDAFSLQRVSDEELRIGVHIAAPALAFRPGSPLDAIARERLSTAYMPGRKFTMLPEDVIAPASLDEGEERVAVSMYLTVSARDFSLRRRESRLERVRVAANLRHGAIEPLNAAFEAGTPAGLTYESELLALWRTACAFETARGKPSVNTANLDYAFSVHENRVAIEPRRRGSPLDKLVSELMIAANSGWGEWLAERDVAAIYRVQSSGKVRMSVHAEAHEGLGVSAYAWMSSPLRRYIDLINQWQLVAALKGERAPFARNSDSLLGAMRAFEIAHARYDEHQRAMENYWCLRWLLQEGVSSLSAQVWRERLVRFERIPLVARVPTLPELAPGTRVRVAIGEIDLLERSLACRFEEVLHDSASNPPAA